MELQSFDACLFDFDFLMSSGRGGVFKKHYLHARFKNLNLNYVFTPSSWGTNLFFLKSGSCRCLGSQTSDRDNETKFNNVKY